MTCGGWQALARGCLGVVVASPHDLDWAEAACDHDVAYAAQEADYIRQILADPKGSALAAVIVSETTAHPRITVSVRPRNR